MKTLDRIPAPLRLLVAAGLLVVAVVHAIPTNPDPCHTAMCTPWANVAILVLNPASDGHQHRDANNLFNVNAQYKTYSVWDDNNYRYNAAMDRSLRKPGDAQDFGHGFMALPARYSFNNNVAAMTDVPMWARPLIMQVIAQWTTINGMGNNVNGVPIQTQIQFQQVAQGGDIEIRFAATFPTPAPGGGWMEIPFPSDIYPDGGTAIPPMPGGGAPQGGREGILAFWTPSLKRLTFNRNVTWYQEIGNPLDPTNRPNEFDFVTTALHEWGHVLGLDHPDNPPANSTMQPTQGNRGMANGILRNLDGGSTTGAKNLYTIARCQPAMPGGGCPQPTPTPTPTPTPVPTPTPDPTPVSTPIFAP
ncbi:MAG TPA: matrixin family metalloprotease [Thermoanaerobaculia bacterium]|nr:matrixin family metalloprotease [Thermoanaerobaculia bacterium]